MFRLKKRRLREQHITGYSFLMRGRKGTGTDLFSLVTVTGPKAMA